MIDGADFEARTTEVGDRLRRRVRSMAGDRLRLLESASDLVQSVFRVMWRKRAAVPSDSRGFWAWAVLEAKRKAAERGRRAAAVVVDPAVLDLRTSPEGGSPADAVAAGESAERLRRAVRLALEELSEADRDVVVACRLHGRTVDEIAAKNDERPNTVSVRLHRALARLALKLPPAE